MTDLNSIPALDEHELDTLGQLLEQEAERNDGFDFFAIHGLMTAMISGPQAFEISDIWSLAFDGEPAFNGQQKATLAALLEKLALEIQAWLDSGQDFPVPCELTLVEDDEDEAPALESWAMGYMSAVLNQEQQWYEHDEAKVAEGLFPMMYASGLFMDEDDIAQIDNDIELSNQMCANIPAAVIELYLLHHSH